jgi:hypothetical protein
MEAGKSGLPSLRVTIMLKAIPANDPEESVFKRALLKMTAASKGLVRKGWK